MKLLALFRRRYSDTLGINTNLFAVSPFAFEFNIPVHHREQGIIAAYTAVVARMKLGTALTNQNTSG